MIGTNPFYESGQMIHPKLAYIPEDKQRRRSTDVRHFINRNKEIRMLSMHSMNEKSLGITRIAKY